MGGSDASAVSDRLPHRLELDLETSGERAPLRLILAGLALLAASALVWMTLIACEESCGLDKAHARWPVLVWMPSLFFLGGLALTGAGCFQRSRIDESFVVDRDRRKLCLQSRRGSSATLKPVATFDMIRAIGVVGRRGPRGAQPYTEFWVSAELCGGRHVRLTDPFVVDGWQPERETASHPVLADFRRRAAVAALMVGLRPSGVSILEGRAKAAPSPRAGRLRS